MTDHHVIVDGARLAPTLRVEADAEQRQLWLHHRKPLDLEAVTFAVPFALVKEWCAQIMQAETTVDQTLWENANALGDVTYDPELLPHGLRFKMAAWKNLQREVGEERAREQSRKAHKSDRVDPLAP